MKNIAESQMLQLATHSDSLRRNWIEIIMMWMEHRLVTLLSINLGTSVLSASKGAASKDIYCNFQISIETGARKLLTKWILWLAAFHVITWYMSFRYTCHYLPCCHFPIIPFYHITSYGLMEQVYALDLASSSKTNGLRSSSSHRCKSHAQNMVGLINLTGRWYSVIKM